MYLMFSQEGLFSGITDRIDQESVCEFIYIQDDELPTDFSIVEKEESRILFYALEKETGEKTLLKEIIFQG